MSKIPFGKRTWEPKGYDDSQDDLAQLEPKAGARVELKGSIDSARIVNEQSGWGFAKLYLDNQRVLVPIVGLVEELYEGANVEIAGVWAEHSRFGWQIKLDRVTVAMPDSGDGVVAWLIHRMPDIGPVKARALVHHFPPPVLWEALEGEDGAETLQAVEGIGPQIARQLVSTYAVWKYERIQFAALAQFGLRPEQIRIAVEIWGSRAVETVEANPYVLRRCRGIGFKQADGIARKMGIKRTDERRVFAGLAYAAELQEREGHTCQSEKKLCSVAASADVLGLRTKFVLPLFATAVERGEIVERGGLYYRPAMAKAEGDLAACVRALLDPSARRSWRLAPDDGPFDDGCSMPDDMPTDEVGL